MKRLGCRILSLILAAVMMAGPCTVAMADDLVLPEEAVLTEQPVGEWDEPLADSVDQTGGPVEEQPAGEAPLPEKPLEEALPEEPLDGEEELPEEAAEELLPYGLAGMPQGYVLSEKELKAKALLKEFEVLQELEKAEPGVDYVENQVILATEDQAYAQTVAQAYGGMLLSCENGVAVIELLQTTVTQAVEAAADPEVPLPAVEPNWLSWLEPIEEPQEELTLFAMEEEIPVKQSWESWYYGLMEDDDSSTLPDTWLQDPNYYRNNRYQWMHDMVNSYEAWGSSTGEGITVAVIDSGVNINHRELQNKVEVVRVSTLPTEAYNDHGTHVAGIIAAKMGNGYMGAGIAPDAKILSLRIVNNSGGISSSNLVAAINLAVSKGADVINLSLGRRNALPAEQQAINKAVAAGVVVVAAMGNEASNIKCYPAAYDNVIAVSAVDKAGCIAPFSCYGSWADISAPGVDISSTYASSDSSSGKMSGTSQACPVVSGVIALYLSRNPQALPAEVEARLKETAAKAGSKEIGGIVDAAELFAADKSAPVISVSYNGTYFASGDDVPFKSDLSITGGEDASNDDMILLSINGKNPTVKDGRITNGFVYDPLTMNKLAHLVELADLPLKKPVTLKAVCINGQGVVGNVASFKLNCAYNPEVESVEISADGEITMVAGSKVDLEAVVLPHTADPNVMWLLDLNGMEAGSVSLNEKTGVLSTKNTAEGSVVVYAYAGSGISGQISIQISRPAKAAKVVIGNAPKTVALPHPNGQDGRYRLEAEFYDTKGNVLTDTACIWSSSKPSVLSVDAKTGLLTARAKGSAIITCKAMDGSGKSGKCTVSVVQLAEEIQLTASTQMVAGSSTTVKAEVLPATANNKKVVWSIDAGAAAAGAKISSSGKLTLPAGFGLSGVTVCAASEDGISAETRIEVLTRKATSVTILTDDPRAVYTSKGVLSKATLFTVDIEPANSVLTADKENQIQLSATANNGALVGWTSGNSKIAEVDQNGLVTVRKPGTVKITATALDGSGRKASVNLTAVTPVSSIGFSITQGSTEWGGQKYYVIGAGKTVTPKVAIGDAYGKPTNKKIEYQLNLMLMDSDRGKAVDSAEADQLLASAAKKGYVKISSSGKITVSRSFTAFWEKECLGRYEVLAELVGVTADGAAKDTVSFLVAPYLTTELTVSRSLVDYSTQKPVPADGIIMSKDAKTAMYVYSDSYWCQGYTFTSSNPNVAGVSGKDTTYEAEYSAHKMWIYSGGSTGKTTITAKATDGSGKSYKFTVTVA